MSATHDFIEDPRNESILIYINGELVPRSEARISVFDSGFLLGDGLWESFRLHNGQLVFFDRHMRRLLENAKALAIDLPFGADEIRRALEKTVEAEVLSALGKAGSLGADPFGLGFVLSTRNGAAWKQLAPAWPDHLRSVPVTVEVRSRVIRTGLSLGAHRER